MKPLDPTARASRPEHDVHLTENVMVPMRDGVRMATDAYRPARAGQPLTDRRPVHLWVATTAVDTDFTDRRLPAECLVPPGV